MPRRPSADRSREGAVGSEEAIMLDSDLPSVPRRDPWNKGRLIGQKRPLKPSQTYLKFSDQAIWLSLSALKAGFQPIANVEHRGGRRAPRPRATGRAGSA